MLTKACIEERKLARDFEFFMETLAPTNDEQLIRFVLQNLGRLPSDFDRAPLLSLLKHAHPDVRLLAVKNLGKLKDTALLDTVAEFANREPNTLTRREAVSTIGRMRTPEAIRGLIGFKTRPLQQMVRHPVRHPSALDPTRMGVH